MSADNRICIMQVSDYEWAVWHGSCSVDYHRPPESAIICSADGANAHARQLESELSICEGGIQGISRSEERVALCEEIRDLAERLERLEKTGQQWKSLEDDSP